MVNGKRVPAGICDRIFNFVMNTLVGKRVKHLTLGGASESVVAIPADGKSNGGELLIEFRHIESKNKKKNSHSRFRGSSGKETTVRRKGKGEDDKDTDLLVIHHPHRRSSDHAAAGNPPAPVKRSDVDEMAEHFIKTRMDAIQKRALNIGSDHH